MDTIQLPTSYSQRLNSGKFLGIGRCEWLWVFALYPSEPLLYPLQKDSFASMEIEVDDTIPGIPLT